jgi:hypothetical protein
MNATASRWFSLSLALVLLVTATKPASAATVTTDVLSGNDGSVAYLGRDQAGVGSPAASSWSSVNSGSSGGIVGVSGSAGSRTANVFAMAFRLPELPAGMQVSTAKLDVYLRAINGTPTFNADLWGLGYRTAVQGSGLVAGTITPNTTTGFFNDVDGDGDPGVGTAVQFSDTADLGAAYGITARAKLMDNMITTASPLTTLAPDTLSAISTSGTALVAFIQSLYDAGAVGGATGDFVVLRLSPDASVNVASNTNRYQLWTNNDSPTTGGSIVAPTLTIEFEPVIPEPATLGLLSVGGVLLLRRR